MVIECIIIRKRVNEDIIVCLYCLGGRPVSMQNFMLIVNILSGLYISKTGSKSKLHNYALPRKKTGLLANIRVHWCYG